MIVSKRKITVTVINTGLFFVVVPVFVCVCVGGVLIRVQGLWTEGVIVVEIVKPTKANLSLVNYRNQI